MTNTFLYGAFNYQITKYKKAKFKDPKVRLSIVYSNMFDLLKKLL